MNNSTTTDQKKSSVQDSLRRVLLVVKLMEDAGFTVLTARVNNERDDAVLFTGDYIQFRKWAESRGLKVDVLPSAGPFHNWRITTNYQGVEIRSYMTDAEKEAYDAAEEA